MLEFKDFFLSKVTSRGGRATLLDLPGGFEAVLLLGWVMFVPLPIGPLGGAMLAGGAIPHVDRGGGGTFDGCPPPGREGWVTGFGGVGLEGLVDGRGGC